jgi:acyl dehydratase
MHKTFESISAGETVELGTYEVTREEILSFAEAYDPQSFHLEETEESPFDGLAASGWHTAAVTMRILVDGYLEESNAQGSLGLDALRWPTPVYPDDRLSASITFGEKEPRDDAYGVVTQEVETVNQDGETVLWMEALVLYPRATQ